MNEGKERVNEAPSLPRAEVSEGEWRNRPEGRGTGRNGMTSGARSMGRAGDRSLPPFSRSPGVAGPEGGGERGKVGMNGEKTGAQGLIVRPLASS